MHTTETKGNKMSYQEKVKPSIITLVIDTFNHSGNKAAKQCLKYLLQIHNIDSITSKQIMLDLKSYI